MSVPSGVDIGPNDWMAEGTCSQSDPDLWFDVNRSVEAAFLCEACPVLERCKVYAETFPVDHGVIAGLLPSERRAAARRAKHRDGVSR